MKRKVMELGHSCYVVSLPKKWVDSNQVSKGDELDLEIALNSLQISTGLGKRLPLAIEVDLNAKELTSTRSVLLNAYRGGYDKISGTFHGDKKLLQNIVKDDMLGFEVFQQKDNLYSIESVSEPNLDKFESILNKLLLLTSYILKNIETEKLEEEVKQAQKFHNFLKRCLTKKVIKDSTDQFDWSFIGEISHITNECFHFQKEKSEFNKKEKEIYKKVIDLLNNLIKAYQKKDIELLKEVQNDCKTLMKDKNDLFSKNNPVNIYYLLYLARIILYATSPAIGKLQM